MVMKGILALLLEIAFCNAYNQSRQEIAWKDDITYDWDMLDHSASWANWKQEFGKTYSDSEESYRFLQFLQNWEFINKFNQERHNYTLGLNQFGDLNVDEFEYYIHGHQMGCFKGNKPRLTFRSDETPFIVGDNPASIDWTNIDGKSYVTPVKNQGSCGSCWAFAATGSLESRAAIAKNQTGASIISLSEQELVDCSTAEGNNGCSGGLADKAFKYIQNEGGLCSESEYQYTALDGTCKATTCGTKYDPITGYSDVKKDSEPDLETAVAAGPVAIGVDAMSTTWQFYKGGIADGHCGVLLDHGVLAVGYDNTGSEKYWKVKNSWGTSWGENGYIRLCKQCGKNAGAGECGILREASYPLLQSTL